MTWLIRSRAVVGTLIGFVVVAGILLAGGQRDYPSLHTMLDATAAVLSGVLALFFWEVGRRTTPLSTWFAIGFGATSVVEGIHALVSVEWSGSLSAVVAAEDTLRPATSAAPCGCCVTADCGPRDSRWRWWV